MSVRTRAVLMAAALFLIARPSPVAAQAPEAARSAHTRAGAGDTTLTLGSARLLVPAGALPRGTMVGLGTGGVPGSDGAVAGTGLVVTYSGGQEPALPLIVVAALSGDDLARLAGAPPALLNTVAGTRAACAIAGVWAACPVPTMGAYVLVAGTAPARPAAAIQRALASLSGADGRSAPGAVVGTAIVLMAAAAGALVAALGRGRSPSATPP